MTATTRSGAVLAGASLAGALLLAAAVVVYRGHVGGAARASAGDCQGADACQRACDSGDACACGAVGALYLHGTSVGRDARRGLSLLDRACDAGCGTACWALGTAYESGSGTHGDVSRANGYFERVNAACRKGCDAGDADGCFTLAGSYLGQHGVTGDHARAEELYARAASLYAPLCDAGGAHACARVAVLADHGLGVPEAKAKATEAYAKACGLGDAESCEEGAKRLTGRDKDVPRDDARARELAHAACAAGRATGCAIASEPDAFMRIVEGACAAGSAFDCGSAAFALLHGAHGVPRDPSRAVPLASRMIELEQDACLDDDGSACAALVRPFDSGTVEGEPPGTIVPRDPARVATLKQRACDLGFRSACPTERAPPGASAGPREAPP